MSPEFWPDKTFSALNWTFGFDNQPNDTIFRDIMR